VNPMRRFVIRWHEREVSFPPLTGHVGYAAWSTWG
jgi:hypothetical protein